MPGVNLLINAYVLETAFGIVLEEGGLEVFEKPATPKAIFFNEWPELSARDYDENAPLVFEPRTLEVPFLIVGNSMEDYRTKKEAFLELIMINGEFSLQILEWGESFRLRYKETVSWEFINTSLDGETSARFVLRFEDNHGQTESFSYLVDGSIRYLVINKNQKILVKSKYG